MYWKDKSFIEYAENYLIPVQKAGLVIMFIVFLVTNILFDFKFLKNMVTFGNSAYLVFGWIMFFCILGPVLTMTQIMVKTKRYERTYSRVSVLRQKVFFHDHVTDKIKNEYSFSSIYSIILDPRNMMFVARSIEEERKILEFLSKLSHQLFCLSRNQVQELGFDSSVVDDYDGLSYHTVINLLEIPHTKILSCKGFRHAMNQNFGKYHVHYHSKIWNVAYLGKDKKARKDSTH